MTPRFRRLAAHLVSIGILSGAVLWIPAARSDVPDGGNPVPVGAMEYGKNGLLHPAPIRPDPTFPTGTDSRSAAPQVSAQESGTQAFASQGWDAMNRREWAKAQGLFAKALELGDDERIRQALMTAQTFMRYEQNLREAERQKGRTLVGMSDCLRALSGALADLKSSVASGALARELALGTAPSLPRSTVLSDASVVDLRRATTSVIALDRLQSPYAGAPQPILPPGSTHLTGRQTARLANLFLDYELGYGTSESDITDLLGLPSPREYGRSGKALTPALEDERRQIGAALGRFREDLVGGCNDALHRTAHELDDDPVTKRIRAAAAVAGADHVDLVLQALWDQRNREAQQRLFVRFSLVQELAIQRLAAQCTMIFHNAPATPTPARRANRRAGP
jgi:hypothetical protein